nr:reverse transcriptase domain-containing protein [Tanacetum cinerariifolium]
SGGIDEQGGQGNHGNNHGNNRNQNGNDFNDNIHGNVRNVIVNNGRRGCSYKEFLACNPKEYDRKRDFKTLTREEFCPINEMQKLETKFWNHAMVGAGHAAYIDRFLELARLVPHLVTPENKRIERNGSLKKNPDNRGNSREPSRDRNVKDDNKRTNTRNDFSTTANPAEPSIKTKGNRPNQVMENNGGQGRGNNGNQAHGRAFMLGAEEAHQDLNIMTGTWEGFCDGSRGGSPGPKHNDRLSRLKAEIICHEKVFRIPLLSGKVLNVVGGRTKEKVRHLMSAKVEEQKQEDIIVVRNYPE